MYLAGETPSGGERSTQGRGRRWRPSNANARWPLPTVPEPELGKLMTWLFSDECEATDGCVVKRDGVCAHGHPSWVVRKEMI
jgi:hypothetical protein